MSVELSVTKKIQRRVLDIYPDPNKVLTPVTISTQNWFQNKDNTRKKFKVSNFILPNSSIPCFIPAYPESVLSVNDLGSGGSNVWVTSPTTSSITNSLGPQTLDYVINIHNSSNNNNYAIQINMNELFSEYPDLKPSIYYDDSSKFYSNRYFYFFNTSKFIELVNTHLKTIFQYLNNQAVLPSVPFSDFIRVSTPQSAYVFYVEDSLPSNIEIQFSKNLIELFQFRSIISNNSASYFRTIVFNTQTKIYKPTPTTSINVYNVISNYVPSTWFPFDSILIKCNGPFEPVIFYDTNSFISNDYGQIILNFNILTTNPDGVYNYFIPDDSLRLPSANWIDVQNNNTGEIMTFEVLLRFSRNNKETIPFTITQSEKASITTEEVHFF